MEMSAEQLCTYKQTGRQPHRHAELIKAWADGAEIQICIDSGTDNKPYWQDILNPSWDGKTYRIKPKTIKYRLYLWKGTERNPIIGIVSYEDNLVSNRNTWGSFIKWVNDWQEVEV